MGKSSQRRSVETLHALDHLRASLADLPASQRRVADAVLADPEAVAFGTVADLAARAATSGPTVLRLADRLGYDGYKGLQQAVRDELGRRLRPAVARIRSTTPGSVVGRTLEVEVANVTESLERIDPAQFERAVQLLADPDRGVWVLPGEQTRPVGANLATELGLLRDRVHLLFGSEFRAVSLTAGMQRADVIVTIDFHRYESWVARVHQLALDRGATPIRITNDAPELLGGSGPVFTVRAESAGPFDSMLGLQAVANALVAEVARRRRGQATRRLDRLERIWTCSGVLEP